MKVLAALRHLQVLRLPGQFVLQTRQASVCMLHFLPEWGWPGGHSERNTYSWLWADIIRVDILTESRSASSANLLRGSLGLVSAVWGWCEAEMGTTTGFTARLRLWFMNRCGSYLATVEIMSQVEDVQAVVGLMPIALAVSNLTFQFLHMFCQISNLLDHLKIEEGQKNQ